VLTLLVLQGPDKGRRFELPDAAVLVGRDSRQLPLTDNTVSRRHCELLFADSKWELRDLGSANGTYINGARVSNRQLLNIGDQIRVGRTLMVFGSAPGVSRASGGNVNLAGAEAGMDSAIMHTVASNDDSMVLAVPEPSAGAVASLKILYQLGAALGSSFRIDQLLDVVMDLVFEYVKADRGIILLLDSMGDLQPKVVRTREDADSPSAKQNGDAKPGSEKIHASRTIINHVLRTGEGVLSSNAMTDQRFSKGKSVHDLGIRSALCVPIHARKLTENSREEALGVIYVDSSVRNYTYSPEQLRLLTNIGLQAGMAIQNAKLYQSGIAAERMAAVGETTAALSHSIKNILQALRGGADVVEMGLKSKNLDQVSKGWRVVDRNLDKIFNLTMNLLTYSKTREPQRELINPKMLVDDCIELMAQSAAAKGAMVVSECESDHPAIPIDASGMHQVIMNLLSNALDAVEPDKGLIRVECGYDPDDRQAILKVIDNGAGIPSSMMNHMFELFHSTKGNRGTGIGLAVAKKIVNEHDGTIEVESPAGEGTTFTIKLPVESAALADPSQTHGPR
jgi:two-component system NtrC family sensor kinase